MVKMRLSVTSKISLVCVGMVCVGLATTFAAQSNAIQSVLYVKADAAGADDGTSWADAYNGLQDGLAHAEAGDDIWVAAGTYVPGATSDRTATFGLKSGVGVYGGFVGTEDLLSERDPGVNLTILRGDLGYNDLEVLEVIDLANESTRLDNSYHVVTGSGANETAILDGFVITGGNANAAGHSDGAGMFNSGGDLNLLNCRFRDNYAVGAGPPENGGAGLYNLDANPTVRDCTFSRNVTRGRGAGMYNWNAAPTVAHCSFEDNLVLSNAFNSMGGGILTRGAGGTPSTKYEK